MSGLAVAWGLAEAGCRVTLIEAERREGGLAGSHFTPAGYTFDYGPHSFYSRDPAIFDRVKNLLGDDLLEYGQLYGGKKIVFRGRTLNYPLSVASAAANLPPHVLLHCAAGYLYSAVRRFAVRPEARNFRDWIVLHFGQGLYDHFFGPFSHKTWGVPPETLAANFASERIPRINPWRLIGALFRISGRTAGKKSGPLTGQDGSVAIHYPRKGYWQISNAIAERVRSAGGEIHLGSRVKELDLAGSRVRGVCFETDSGDVQAEADWVISTIPVPELVRALPDLDPDTRDLGLGLTYRGLALLFLEVARPQVLDTRVVYFHDEDILFQRGSEVRHLSSEMVPGKGRTGVTLEITDNGGMSDEDILSRSVADLERLGLLDAWEVENHSIVRRPYCYPVYTVGYQERLQRYLAGMGRFENLLHCGRQALFRYVDVYQCLQMGLATAKSILDGTAPGEMNGIVSSWGEVKN
jgi:protoporphyrinogen oxidase